MSQSILSGITRRVIQTEREIIEIFRIGIFNGRTVELVELNQGQFYPPHVHQRSEARLQVIIGEGIIVLDGRKYPYKPGDAFVVSAGVSHGFHVEEQTVLLSTQDAPILDMETGEMDIFYTDV